MLQFYSYRMQVFHELIPGDNAKRVNSCRWFKNLIRGNICVLDQVFFTDEASFHLSGYVNSQNYRTWKTENPHNYTETPLHPQKIGVWCAISRLRIIGPLFFETSVHAEAYKELIQQFIALLQVDERNCWFQQDSQLLILLPLLWWFCMNFGWKPNFQRTLATKIPWSY